MNDPLDSSLRQLLGAWEVLCAPFSGFTRESEPGLEFVFSGLSIPFFNIAVLTGRGISREGLAELGARAAEWASPSALPWFLIVTQEGLAARVDAAGTLAGLGLVPILPLTGMLAQCVAPLAALPEGLELVRPEDDAGCASVVDVNSAAYGMDLAAAKPGIGTRAFWREHVPVLGRANGAAAASSAVLRVDGHRYVALVATHPTVQRRGYADAAMRRSLELAAALDGERPTFLHATDAGRPVYERMGYRALTQHLLFIDRRFVPTA